MVHLSAGSGSVCTTCPNICLTRRQTGSNGMKKNPAGPGPGTSGTSHRSDAGETENCCMMGALDLSLRLFKHQRLKLIFREKYSETRGVRVRSDSSGLKPVNITY